MDDFERDDGRTTNTARRAPHRTDRLSDDIGDQPDRDWRRRGRGAARARPSQRLPSSGQEFVVWLERGGWKIAVAAFAVVVLLVLALIVTRPPSALPTEEGLALDAPTAAVFGGEVAQPGANVATPGASQQPTLAPAPPQNASFVVSGTGVEGLFLRPEPNTNNAPIKTLPEGTVVTVIGEDSVGPNYTWKHVRDPEGTEGWAAADFLQLVP